MKKTRLFKHFITLIHCCALAIPLFTLIGTFIFNYLAPTAYFASHKTVASSEKEYVNISFDDLSQGEYYLFVDAPYTDTTNSRFSLYVDGDVIWNNTILSNVNYISFYIDGVNNTPYLFTNDSTNGNSNYINLTSYTARIKFNLTSKLKTNNLVSPILNDFYYLTYNNDFEDMKNYQPKTFDDACFYTMQSIGVAYDGDDVIECLYNSTGEDIYNVWRLYDLGYSCADFYTFNGVVNYDWLEMFNINLNFKENTTNGSWYFFINFYINYFINVSLILFMPIVIMGFLKFCTNLILKFIEKGEDY